MIETNIYNLPLPVVSAIRNDQYDKVGDISTTGLVSAPRRRILEIRHQDEIVEDVSENLYRLLGDLVHTLFERADTRNHLAEERLTRVVHGWVISGKPDLLTPEMILQDYKVTSVYAFLLGDKPEWEAQLNIYAWLYRKYGFEATAAQIVAILRDWQKRRAAREDDYPPAGFFIKNIPLWTPEEQEAFLIQRVRAHQQAERLADNDLPECTAEERWHKPDVWAVKKMGNKKAMRGGLHSSEASAQAWAMQKSVRVEIEYRPGESTRCALFCAAAPFCSQWAKIKGETK